MKSLAKTSNKIQYNYTRSTQRACFVDSKQNHEKPDTDSAHSLTYLDEDVRSFFSSAMNGCKVQIALRPFLSR